MNCYPTTFKLLAVRPLKGCKDYILKCLHEDVTYYLCNDFSIESNDEGKYIVTRNIHAMSAQVSDNFFSLDSYSDDNPQKDSIKINMSAVVAKKR